MKELKINNIPVYLLPETRFKSCYVGVYFLSHLEDKFVAEKLLLASLLSKTNEMYPVEEDLSYQLENLYDTRIGCSVGSVGLVNTVHFRASFINPKFLTNANDLLKNVLEELFNCIFKPSFTKEKFELEKNLYIKEYLAIYNNKERYASIKFMKYLLGKEPSGIGHFGLLKKMRAVTLDSLKEAYYDMIKNPCAMYFLGDMDEALIKKSLEAINLERLNPYYYDESYQFRHPYIKHPRTIKYHEDKTDDSQSILYMGYRQIVPVKEEDVFTYNFFNTMLGDFSGSSLFTEVREKKGLCYSISSSISTRCGYLAVAAGIGKDSDKTVISMVESIINDFANGKISEDLLDLTKTYLISVFTYGKDSQTYMLTQFFDKIYGLKTLTLEEQIDMVNKITIEDMVKCAKSYKLDTIYVLRGEL